MPLPHEREHGANAPNAVRTQSTAHAWLLQLFGGRQSARSIHFLCMSGLSLFILVHLALVILAGVGNELRSMITGRWRVPAAPPVPARPVATEEPAA